VDGVEAVAGLEPA